MIQQTYSMFSWRTIVTYSFHRTFHYSRKFDTSRNFDQTQSLENSSLYSTALKNQTKLNMQFTSLCHQWMRIFLQTHRNFNPEFFFKHFSILFLILFMYQTWNLMLIHTLILIWNSSNKLLKIVIFIIFNISVAKKCQHLEDVWT